MEQRLIDANALMDALNVFKDRKNGNEHFMYGIETAKELLGIQPTVDAVPIDFLKQFADGKRGYYSDFVIESVMAYKDGERKDDGK